MGLAVGIRSALERWGAFLLRPRATVAALGRGEGAFDGLWLGLAYVFGSQLIALGQAVKALSITMDASGALTMVGAMGRMVLPPILLSLAVEMVLGRDRAYRRGVFLAPLVLVCTAANLSRQFGYAPWSEFAPAFVGGVWALALVFWTRGQIPPETEATTPTTGDTTGDTSAKAGAAS